MFVINNFVGAIARLLDLALTVYMYCIIARALLSWVNPDPRNPIVQLLTRVTEPALRPLRRLVPAWHIGIDIAPILAILAIYFLQWFLVASLWDLSRRMS
jgi:YggT family protein